MNFDQIFIETSVLVEKYGATQQSKKYRFEGVLAFGILLLLLLDKQVVQTYM